MKVTISFGGAMMVPEKPDASTILSAANVLVSLKKRRHDVFVVVGGGHQARVYMQQGVAMKLSRAELDKIGIEVTRLNARMLIAAMGKIAEEEPPKTVEAAVETSFRNKIPIMGGTVPGHTTDAVAAMLAKASRSDILVIFTDVDAIYTKDPKLYPAAEKIQEMTTKDLVKMFGKIKREPGMKLVVDPIAAQLVDKHNIKTLVLGKSELERLEEILNGAEHGGTTIKPVS